MEGLEQAPEAQDQLDDQPEQQEEQNEPQLNPDEDKARSGGWRPKEDWIEAGNDADDWKSARSFNEYGDLISSIKSQKRDLEDSKASFDSRLDNVNKMHKAQMEAQMSDLKTKQLAHVENADVESYNNTQKQIDDLQSASNQVADKPTHNPDIDSLNTWNTSNAWINDNSPKAAFAKSEFNRLNNSGMSVSQSIEMMEQSVRTSFPDVNERRNQANRSESPRRANTAKPKSLSMAEVTQEEMKMRNFFTGKDSEKQFLQAVKDSRG